MNKEKHNVGAGARNRSKLPKMILIDLPRSDRAIDKACSLVLYVSEINSMETDSSLMFSEQKFVQEIHQKISVCPEKCC